MPNGRNSFWEKTSAPKSLLLKIRNLRRSILDRCYRPGNCDYRLYGGRGITVCAEWGFGSGSVAFCEWAIANGYEDGLQIDRVDVNGNYEPSNCRFVKPIQNHVNRRVNGKHGVGVERTYQKYRARITVGGKCHHLGMFATAAEAAQAYREAVKRFHGVEI